MAWQIGFYIDETRSSPIQEFIDSLPIHHRAKVFQRLQLLSEWGPNLPFPYSSQVQGPLRELRVVYGRVQYRILYYGDKDRVFVLLHALRKQTKAIPEQDVYLALQRMQADRQLKGG